MFFKKKILEKLARLEKVFLSTIDQIAGRINKRINSIEENLGKTVVCSSTGFLIIKETAQKIPFVKISNGVQTSHGEMYFAKHIKLRYNKIVIEDGKTSYLNVKTESNPIEASAKEKPLFIEEIQKPDRCSGVGSTGTC